MEKDDNIIITFSSIIKRIWLNKWTLVCFGCFGILLGIITALSMTKSYKAVAKAVPEETNNDLGQMGNLASIVGSKLNLGNDKDAISPKLYPQVLSTNKFILGLFNTPIVTKDGKVKTTYADYIQSYQKKSVLGNLFGAKNDSIADLKHINPFSLSKRQTALIKEIGQRIMCSVDDNTDIITISVIDQDPLVAATMTNKVMVDIQQYITNYRTGKARQDMENTHKLLIEAKTKYKKAQQLYAAYSDANEDVVLQSFQSKRDEMENEMQLRYNIYTSLLQQYQVNQAKVQERTPVYTVLESATVPVRPTGIGRGATIIGCFIIFLFFGLTWVFFFKDIYVQTKAYMKKK